MNMNWTSKKMKLRARYWENVYRQKWKINNQIGGIYWILLYNTVQSKASWKKNKKQKTFENVQTNR